MEDKNNLLKGGSIGLLVGVLYATISLNFSSYWGNSLDSFLQYTIGLPTLLVGYVFTKIFGGNDAYFTYFVIASLAFYIIVGALVGYIISIIRKSQ